MKSFLFKTLLVMAACLPVSLTASRAQSYSIDWYKISGGGGTSTGGIYSVSGSIGQPDASGALTGGNYSVTGGFWSLYAVQTPGAPLLTITYSANKAIVSWPSPATGFVLQQNSNLTNTNGWSNFGGIIGDNGTIKSVTNAPPTGNLFFRLKQ
jgi:hypothetical protein